MNPHTKESAQEDAEAMCKALNRASRCEYAPRLCLKKLIPENQIDEVVKQVRNADFSALE